ncbi:unnamed protein product, partial [Soboliphyme baturini]|uniref:WD_REPEATS_REGION domain-containing protein n=1 Tax=Soboliphyme baturini TaxID=241478 RepID=A0A183IW07_9BILA
MVAAACESHLFVRCKAVGLVTSAVPFALSFLKTSRAVMVYCAVENIVYKYTCSNMALIAVSDPFSQDIRRLAVDDRFVYVAYGHNVAVQRLNGPSKCVFSSHAADVNFLLPFGSHLLSVDSESHAKVWDVEAEEEYTEIIFDRTSFDVTAVCHPLTYINKVLFGSSQGSLRLINLKSNKLVYEFAGWSNAITVLEQSPALDVMAIGLADGRIFLHNLKFDESLFSFNQDCGPVTAIAFRTDDSSSMVTGTTIGRLTVWDLEKRSLDSMLDMAHDGAVLGLTALPREPIVLSSGQDNALKMWAFDSSAGAPRLLMCRQGHSRPPNFIRFHAASDFVLSGGDDSSLKLFDVAEEKHSKNLGVASFLRRSVAKKHKLDLDKNTLPGIICLDSNSTRESSWDNVVCCHRNSAIVTSWTTRRCRLGSHRFRHPRFKTDIDLRSACALCCRVSPCGNFVFIGYSTGHVDIFNI